MIHLTTRFLTLTFSLFIALAACASESPPAEEPVVDLTPPVKALPVLFENSLANESLTADTLILIRKHQLTDDCDHLDDIFVDVSGQPSGNAGEMTWTEIWIVTGCGATRNYGIGFAEDGEGGAFFSVSPQ